jgi:acyl-CoA reductase-like NAD-dependent aldehyde dehydrogenase
MTPIFINGTFEDAASGVAVPVLNPANSQSLADIAECSAADIDRAVSAAAAALPAWSAQSEDDRYTALQAVAAQMRARHAAIVSQLVAEGGLTQREARASVDAAVSALEYPPAHGHAGSRQVRAVFGPASSPLLPVVRQVTSALLAGDTVVVSPPLGATLANLEAAHAWSALPAGVVNVLSGGRAVAQTLAAHPHVGAISMTGSKAAAAHLAATGRPLSQNVGVADVAVVRRDADLDLAVRAVAWSRLRHGGRACLSSRRLYVDAAIAQDFVVRLHEYVGVLEVDDPRHEASVLGPLGSAEAAKACEGRVVKSMREGARLVLGGFRFRPSGLKGSWLQPTILADVREGMLPLREEMAGPVLTVANYTDDAALHAALAAESEAVGISVYGADVDELCAWAAPLPATAIWINVPQSDYAPSPAPGVRPTYRPAYASGVVPDFYSLDPLRVWSLT